MRRTVLIALVCFAAAVAAAYMDQTFYPLILREEVRYVPPETVAEILSLDQRGAMADFLFVQVSLHSGSLMWKPLKFQFDSDWAYGMIDLITDLDPKFYKAYLFASMGLIHNFDDVYRARPILEKGMAHFPDSWELPFWIGYTHYVYQDDVEVAAPFLWQASKKPDAPERFMALMLSVLKKAGDYPKAYLAMKEIYESAEDENVKTVYAKKMLQLENLMGLQAAAEEYRKRKGDWPGSVDDLVDSGLIQAVPRDPLGMYYVWNDKKERVVLKLPKADKDKQT